MLVSVSLRLDGLIQTCNEAKEVDTANDTSRKDEAKGSESFQSLLTILTVSNTACGPVSTYNPTKSYPKFTKSFSQLYINYLQLFNVQRLFFRLGVMS